MDHTLEKADKQGDRVEQIRASTKNVMNLMDESQRQAADIVLKMKDRFYPAIEKVIEESHEDEKDW